MLHVEMEADIGGLIARSQTHCNARVVFAHTDEIFGVYETSASIAARRVSDHAGRGLDEAGHTSLGLPKQLKA